MLHFINVPQRHTVCSVSMVQFFSVSIMGAHIPEGPSSEWDSRLMLAGATAARSRLALQVTVAPPVTQGPTALQSLQGRRIQISWAIGQSPAGEEISRRALNPRSVLPTESLGIWWLSWASDRKDAVVVSSLWIDGPRSGRGWGVLLFLFLSYLALASPWPSLVPSAMLVCIDISLSCA